VSSFIEIPPLSEDISRHAKYVLTAGRTTKRKHKNVYAMYKISSSALAEKPRCGDRQFWPKYKWNVSFGLQATYDVYLRLRIRLGRVLRSPIAVFTALHVMQTRYSEENSVCPSVCLSVCPSVRLSVTRVIPDKTEERSVQIFIPYERTFILVF